VLRRQVKRPEFQPADRAVFAALSRGLPRGRWSSLLVTLDTILRQARENPPLALRIAAANLADRQRTTVADYAAELATGDRLGEARAGALLAEIGEPWVEPGLPATHRQHTPSR
jgi:hypothetical protein